MTKEQTDLVTELIDGAEDPDWATALLSTGLDNGLSVEESVKWVEQTLKDQPKTPQGGQ